MPGLDGYGVLEKLRGMAETATTPFIFLTAFAEKANMRQGMEKGADDFLVKPFSREELIAAIDAQWHKHSRIEKKMQKKVEEVGRNVTYALPHELRTVLNQVAGSAKYLKSSAESVTPDEIRELSEDIITSSQRLLKITENFLIIVRIESFIANQEKRRQLRTFRTDEPTAMIADIASIIADNYNRRKDLEMTERILDIEEIAVEISTERIYKIIYELTDNAFKFSEEGTIIRLDMWLDNEFLFIQIADSGRGMSKEQIANIGAYVQFERTIYEQQGVGLGLVIAKRLVELHDGFFEISSEEGIGTTVTLSLPFVNINL